MGNSADGPGRKISGEITGKNTGRITGKNTGRITGKTNGGRWDVNTQASSSRLMTVVRGRVYIKRFRR